ncbi:alpha/beta fold hydrolase [Paenibacillus harenae]|uniref:alpha/beta fold hydrolase n=1 Tax=Paenibacillus harenae TaxID=306543 RepID=UPI0003FFD1D5|nr:alpha/beta hydrolase [Paenibacillus harenae]
MKLLSRKREFEISGTGISAVEILNIGGIEQSILIQAQHIDKPVLLFIHGGPSMPLPGVSCRDRDYTVATSTKELIQHYVLVFWDQRGTGKSYHPSIPKESITLSQFISDAEELVDYLRKRFNQDKIVIAAHSWGSIIGLSLAAKIPDKLHAYIGISQIVDWPENDRLCREWAINEAKKRGHKKAVDELTRLGEPPYTEGFKQWGMLRKWLMKYNSMIYKDKEIQPPSLLDAVKIMLHSPDYTLKDIYNSFYKGFIFSFTQQMIEDFSTVNFIKSAKNIDIPIHFIHGRKDVHVYGSLVQTYFDQLNATNSKHLFWVEKSSHMFHPDDAKEIENILIKHVGAAIDQYDEPSSSSD